MIHAFTREGKPVFHLRNEVSSLLFQVRNNRLELAHFGCPVQDGDLDALAVRPGTGWGTAVYHEGLCSDELPLLWSGNGTGDYRESPLELYEESKVLCPDFVYSGFTQQPGGVSLSGLPQARGAQDTLTITLQSEKCEIRLLFSVFPTAITRRTIVKNRCREPLTVGKCMSQMLDLPGEYTMHTLDGGWIRETHIHKTPVSDARVVNESTTGFSSNRHNPGFVLQSGDECYGFNLIYSGNHYASAQSSVQNRTRVMQGISPAQFRRTLAEGEEFCTPEAVICYSDEGLNGLRKNMHDFVNRQIIPPHWQFRERPVVFNDWEGCMFSFTEKKLLSLARKAKSLGCEVFVLDDGWMQGRNNDTAGLGDYSVNKDKLPDDLGGLSAKIHEMGMQFGLWFEPEAVNPDSDLYRAHPDWAITAAKDDLLGRNELLLDLRKEEVRDYLVTKVTEIIDRAQVNFVKWDMNRHSVLTGADAHDYILGLYDVLGRIFQSRPEILLESCGSGGNRFDLGMLCYGAQIWASDDTDPLERLEIQKGLSTLYPLSAISCHVSDSPHMQTLRATPLSTRINVAMFGVFGVEMDLDMLSPVDLQELREAIGFYRKNRKLFQYGIFREEPQDGEAESWCVSDEGKLAVGLFHRLCHAAPGYERLKLPGLEAGAEYEVTARQQLLRAGTIAGLVKYIAPVHLHPDGIVARTANHHYRMKDGSFHTRCSGNALKSGIALNPAFSGTGYNPQGRNGGDFMSGLYLVVKSSGIGAMTRTHSGQ